MHRIRPFYARTDTFLELDHLPLLLFCERFHPHTTTGSFSPSKIAPVLFCYTEFLVPYTEEENMAAEKFPQVSGMTVVISTVILYFVNAIILVLAQMFFPQHIVLGTHALPYYWAVFMSMGKLTLLTTFVMPFVSKYELMRKKIFSPMEWMALYFVVNFVGLWMISRFSEQFGLGFTSWTVVLVLAAVLDFAQGMAMMAYGSMMKK
jgi:hypothetical protein